MAQFTVFGKATKKALVDIERTQEWLMNEVVSRTGLFLDSGYLYKILTGQRSAPKIVQAIQEILDLPEQSQYITDSAQALEQSENNAQREAG